MANVMHHAGLVMHAVIRALPLLASVVVVAACGSFNDDERHGADCGVGSLPASHFDAQIVELKS